MPPQHVLIAGGGLAGLCCARSLHEAGVEITLVEATDRLGGRVQTDTVDGFQIDRGFQVLSTAYPEAQQALDYPALDLRSFTPGALVRWQGKFHRLCDPRRRPDRLLETATSPLATLGDKLRTVLLTGRLDHLTKSDTSTADALRNLGFSDQIVERFWRPLLSGVFLERELTTSSNVFAFVVKMFAAGDVAVPADGMRAISDQLAATLPADAIRLNTSAASINAAEMGARPAMVLENGERLEADALVIATDAYAASRLLGLPKPDGWRAVRTLSFAADRSPLGEPILVLNGNGSHADPAGPINSLAVMSDVAPGYAPDGRALISVSVLIGDNGDPLGGEAEVRSQLTEWFGDVAHSWALIDDHTIRHALPDQRPGTGASPPPTPAGVYACGDWLSGASINGAMLSGRKTAQQILAAGDRVG